MGTAIRRTVGFTTRWTVRGLLAAVLLVATVALTWGFLSRDLPELEPWHTEAPAAEVGAGDIDERFTLADYLEREAAAMREVREEIEVRTAADAQSVFNRYWSGSRVSPARFSTDWNRSFELTPAVVRGGALLVHGMTDAPYSMRAVARILADEGYYALALRMPGHGTVPAGLARVHWRDWSAAVRMGVRHVRQRIGAEAPLVVVGYSNGGALALHYALEALDDQRLPQADRLVLLSPMIGVTPAARLSPVISLFSRMPYFNRSAWTGIQPEYNPFKYNSFPANAGYQSHLVTRELDRLLLRAHEAGRLADLPPVLTFQSIVDSTVQTGAIIDRLYDRLPASDSALVMFDLNRQSSGRLLMRGPMLELFDRLFGRAVRRYGISVVTNVNADTLEVAEKAVAPGTRDIQERPLGLAWPRGVFSLSHVAVPFPMDDPLYGLDPDLREDYGLRLGRVELRGERGVLLMSADDTMRLMCNPFFPYLEERVRAWVAPR